MEESQISGSKSWISTNSSWRVLESSFWGSGITPWPRYSPAGTMSGSNVAVAGGADACWSALWLLYSGRGCRLLRSGLGEGDGCRLNDGKGWGVLRIVVVSRGGFTGICR